MLTLHDYRIKSKMDWTGFERYFDERHQTEVLDIPCVITVALQRHRIVRDGRDDLADASGQREDDQ